MRLSGESGVSAIEFAILLPFLVLLTFGIIEFGILLYNQQVITNASREGARHGIKYDYNTKSYSQWTSIEDTVKAYIYPQFPNTSPSRLITLSSAPVTITVTPGTGTCTSFGNELEVDVSFQYSFLLLDNFGFSNPVLTARTSMNCE